MYSVRLRKDKTAFIKEENKITIKQEKKGKKEDKKNFIPIELSETGNSQPK